MEPESVSKTKGVLHIKCYDYFYRFLLRCSVLLSYAIRALEDCGDIRVDYGVHRDFLHLGFYWFRLSAGGRN